MFTAPPLPPSGASEAPPSLSLVELSRVLETRNHLGSGEALTTLLLTALDGKSAGSIAKVIVDRALPPAPSRAETWWLKTAPAARIPSDATLADLSHWLYELVTRGELSPAIAAELVGQFRVLEAAGGLPRTRTRGGRGHLSVV